MNMPQEQGSSCGMLRHRGAQIGCVIRAVSATIAETAARSEGFIPISMDDTIRKLERPRIRR